MIKRRANNPHGEIGYYYDIYQDRVVEQSALIDAKDVVVLYDKVECEIIDGKTEKFKNLLKWIKFDDDQRLSTLLNEGVRTGISAVINYNSPIDEYTRFMRYFSRDRSNNIPQNYTFDSRRRRSIARDIHHSHMITGITFGIDLIIILRLPPKALTANCIDAELEKVRQKLENKSETLACTEHDEFFLKKIIEIKVYSNVPVLNAMASLLEICQFINETKLKRDTYLPVEYTLQPVESVLKKEGIPPSPNVIPMENVRAKLEENLIEMLNYFNKAQYLSDQFNEKKPPNHLSQSVTQTQEEWKIYRETFKNSMKYLKDLVVNIRMGEMSDSEIDKFMNHTDQISWKKNIRELWHKMKSIQKEYKVVNSEQQDSDRTGNLFSFMDDQEDRRQILKSTSDMVTIKNLPAYYDVSKEFDKNAHPTETEQKNESIGNTNPTKLPSNETPTPNASPNKARSEEIINILLLGESGVGKSTFINALVNYLTFGTLDKAENGKPVVLIPVSFRTTTGDHFEERIIKFGDPDQFNNEDFDHPGQSVTQHCRSYTFTLNQIGGQRIRIIDTPGFGDTRGFDQDDLNLLDILEYINGLRHLNAICFLLKPNASKVHNFFPTCLTQILDLLGTDACHNIVFCFTNSRSTFYAPGDTAPLLKSVLKTSGFDDIPFKKENTFCFDNESFRYLVAKQDGIQFTNEQHVEYESSWSTSVKVSEKFLHYVCKNLQVHNMQIGHQSIKHAQLQINQMIRPMLETIRNILRNIIIHEWRAAKNMIQLQPQVVPRITTLCLKCKRDSILLGKFWIVTDSPHQIRKACEKCRCSADQHTRIDYTLEYKYCKTDTLDEIADMAENVRFLIEASALFAYFIMNIAHSSKDDPFWIGIVQMITEENDICNSQTKSELNARLAIELQERMWIYEQHLESIKPNQENNKLVSIYKLIQKVNEIPMVAVQMSAALVSRENIMEQFEINFQ